jgi:hypothetical protein
VLVTAIEESFSILYRENTGRTLSEKAKMSLDPIGTFFSHKVTVKRKSGAEREYDDLFEYISEPRTQGIKVEIAHNQGVLKYEAYVSSGARSVKKIIPQKNTVVWDEMTITFIPMEAQVSL